jgi:hypothetical protein
MAVATAKPVVCRNGEWLRAIVSELMGSPNTRIAFVLRLVGFLVCSPLQAVAYVVVSHSLVYGVLLAYVPLAAGWFGLIHRPLRDALNDRETPLYEFSAKGAILGMAGTFALLLLFAPHGTDRSRLIVLFCVAGLVYYAIGKCGCIAIGCCRAERGIVAGIRLPLIEAVVSAVLAVVLCIVSTASSRAYFATPVIIMLVFAGLRVASRIARGERGVAALRQFDSLALLLIAAGIAVAAIAR